MPVQNDLNFVLSHVETIGSNDKSEVLDISLVEFAFRGSHVKSVLAESS